MEDRRTNRTSKLGLCCRGFVVPLRWDFVDGFVRLLHLAGGGAGQRFGPHPVRASRGWWFGIPVSVFACYFNCLFSVFI